MRINCLGRFSFPNVELVYSQFKERDSSTQPVSVSYDVMRVGDSAQTFSYFTSRNGVELAGPVDYGECGRLLIKQLQDEAISTITDSSSIALHAAAIELSGEATVLPASSRGGKSTLVIAAVTSAFRYMTDELAITELKTGVVRSFPLAPKVRDDVIGLFPNETLRGTVKVGDAWSSDPNHHMNYVQLRSNVVVPPNERIPIKQFVFIKYFPDAEVEIRRLHPQEGAKRLLLCSRRTPNPGQTIPLVLSLSQTLPSYEIIGSVPAKMAEAVRELPGSIREVSAKRLNED